MGDGTGFREPLPQNRAAAELTEENFPFGNPLMIGVRKR